MSGLSLWPGVQGLELHALLSEAPSAGDFGRPKRELFHRPKWWRDSGENLGSFQDCEGQLPAFKVDLGFASASVFYDISEFSYHYMHDIHRIY